MISRLLEWCLKYRYLVLLFYLVFVGAGLYAVKNTPVDAIPDIGENQQIVFTDWPGRSPKDIEDQITYPLSVSLQGIPGIKTIRASSAFGFSIIYIIFEDDIDFYWSRTRILERMATAQRGLPEGVVPELGPDATALGQIFWYTVESDSKNIAELRSIQDWYVRYQLQAVKGVAEVASVGGYVKQYQVDVDPVRMFVHKVKLSEVFNSIRRSNIDVGAKVIEESKMEFLVRGIGFIKSVEDIENIVVGETKGVPIYVKNIASVQIGPDFRRNALDKNGKEAVGGVVLMRYGENPRDIINNVKEKLKELKSGLPSDVSIHSFYDRTDLIGRTMNTLSTSLLLEILITILVIFFFLRHFSSSFIVSLTLPFAVLASLSALYVFKMDSNIMSLSGIIIAIGTMVDMSIILMENIFRHFHDPKLNQSSRMKIILGASKEVGPAIVTAILTTIVSFLPVFALEGQEGKLFHPLAYTKTFALLGSVIVSLTLVPVLASFLFKKNSKPRETTKPKADLLDKLSQLYKPSLGWALQNKKLFLLIPALVVLLASLSFTRIGREFMPPLNEGDILFMPVMLPSVSLTEALRIMQQQDRIIKRFPEVERVVGKLGRAETATDPAPVAMFETMISLKPESEWRKGMNRSRLISEMNEALKIPGVANIWTQPISNRVDMLSTGIRTQVGVKIFGPELGELERIASEVEGVLRGVPGAVDLYAEKIVGKPYIEIEINRRQISRYGIKVQDVQEVIQTAIGGVNLTHTYEGRERYPVRVRYKRELRDNEEALKRILVPTPSGHQIPLGQLATIRRVMGPAMINSENGALRAYVLLNVRGRDLIGFVDEASRVVSEQIKLPPGYYLNWSGQFENEVRAKKKLMVLVPLSLFINFLILFFGLGSIATTMIVFLAIPISLAGGILLLWVSGFNMSVAVWVGFIALFGIAVDGGVVLITYLDQVFKKKKPRTNEEIREATIEASLLRLRPLLMTMATTVFALMPVLITTGTGAEVMKPMAIPTVGGMFVVLLSFYFVPVLYSWIQERNLLKQGNGKELDAEL